MAVLAAAALLDELMGRNRNIAPNEKGRELNWEDPEVIMIHINTTRRRGFKILCYRRWVSRVDKRQQRVFLKAWYFFSTASIIWWNFARTTFSSIPGPIWVPAPRCMMRRLRNYLIRLRDTRRFSTKRNLLGKARLLCIYSHKIHHILTILPNAHDI